MDNGLWVWLLLVGLLVRVLIHVLLVLLLLVLLLVLVSAVVTKVYGLVAVSSVRYQVGIQLTWSR